MRRVTVTKTAALWVLSVFLSTQIAVASNQYEVTVKGQKAGQAVLSISQNDQDYQVKLALFPVLLAKMFGINDMTETAKGVVRKGHLYPQSYRRLDKKGNSLLTVKFAKQQANINSRKDGEKSLEIATLGQDPLSQMAQIRLDLKNGAVKSTYYLVTDSAQQSYSAVQQGKKVTLTQQPSKNRQLILWFDEAYELVKMQKNKKGRVQFLMEKS